MKEIFGTYGKILIAVMVGLTLLVSINMVIPYISSLIRKEVIYCGENYQPQELIECHENAGNLKKIQVNNIENDDGIPLTLTGNDICFSEPGIYKVYFDIYYSRNMRAQGVLKIPVNRRMEAAFR